MRIRILLLTVCLLFSLSSDASGTFSNAKNPLSIEDQSISTIRLVGTSVIADFQYDDTCQNSPTQFTLIFSGPDSVFWNFGDLPSGALNNSTVLNPQHIYTTSGNKTVQCIVYAGGFPDTAIKTINIISEPLIFPTTDSTICSGNTVFLDVTNIVPGFSFQWNDGYPDPYRFIDTDGTYIATVSIGSCTKTSAFTLHTLDEPNVYLGEDTVLCSGGSWLLNASFPSSNYLWQDGSTAPTYTAYSTRTYGVQVSNQCGIAADSIYLEFDECSCNVYFPSAFTPNSDNHNEQFNFNYDCLDFQSNIKIFSRWGNLVFESDDAAVGWDGTYKGKDAIEDIYIYILKYSGVIDGTSQEIVKRGTFLLMR